MSLLVKHFYSFGHFDLDAEQRVIRRDGKKIALPPKAFDLLFYLVRNPLRLVTKEELLRAVWPDSFVEEGNLTQNIFLLRKALTTENDDVRYIVTIPGRGYQFTSVVEMADQPSEAGELLQPDEEPVGPEPVPFAKPSAPPAVSNGKGPSVLTNAANYSATLPVLPMRRRKLLPAAAVFLILGLLAAFFFGWRNHRQPTGSQTLVLADFENRTGDGSFDVVLKKALEIDLTQSPYLDVMSDQGAMEVLRLMGRDPNSEITPDVAKEICPAGQPAGDGDRLHRKSGPRIPVGPGGDGLCLRQEADGGEG